MSDSQLATVDHWLEGLGFVRGNPFATVTAEHERGLLPMFFVHVDGYERARAELSVVVFAPRGCGKSALRVQLASDSAPVRPEAGLLAVEYTDFDPLIAIRRAGRPVTVGDHLPWLLRAGYVALFTALCGSADQVHLPETNERDRAARAARANSVDPADRLRLGGFLRRYAPHLLESDWFAPIFGAATPNIGLHQQHIHANLAAAAGAGRRDADAITGLLVDLLTPTTSELPEATPTESVAALVRLARAAGFRHVQFLIDRVDEYYETADQPEIQADLLESLLAHLPLLELPGASFKFFLAHATRDTLLARPTIRSDRVGNYAVVISWSPQRLKELLDERLSVFSDGAVSELIQICADSTVGVLNSGAQIEQELLSCAGDSPRRLLLAGQLLVQAHVRRAGPTGLITLDDWLAARAELMQRMPPTLLVRRDSQVVQLGARTVELSLQPYKVLLTLAQAAGPCRRSELAEQAWGAGAGVSDEAINQVIRRLREALDDDARRPIYLKVSRRSDTIELCHAELE